MFTHSVVGFYGSFPLRNKQFVNKKREICNIGCIAELQTFCLDHNGESPLADLLPVYFTADLRTQP